MTLSFLNDPSNNMMKVFTPSSKRKKRKEDFFALHPMDTVLTERVAVVAADTGAAGGTVNILAVPGRAGVHNKLVLVSFSGVRK